MRAKQQQQQQHAGQSKRVAVIVLVEAGRKWQRHAGGTNRDDVLPVSVSSSVDNRLFVLFLL